jgi:hypothetical protein
MVSAGALAPFAAKVNVALKMQFHRAADITHESLIAKAKGSAQ